MNMRDLINIVSLVNESPQADVAFIQRWMTSNHGYKVSGSEMAAKLFDCPNWLPGSSVYGVVKVEHGAGGILRFAADLCLTIDDNGRIGAKQVLFTNGMTGSSDQVVNYLNDAKKK